MAGNRRTVAGEENGEDTQSDCEVGSCCRLCFSERASGTVKSATAADFNRKPEKNIKFRDFWLGNGKE